MLNPDESLLLAKPLMKVPHGGGMKLRKTDSAYALMRQWIAEGCKQDADGAPRCVKIEVQPPTGRVLKRPAHTQQLSVLAHFSDGSVRDVTDLACYSSSDSEVADVTAGVIVGVVALPLGVVAAIYRGRAADVLAMGFAVVGQATPYFWMGIVLILVVSVELAWLPTSGRGDWRHLILPAVTLGTHFAASLARLTRTSMLEVLGQNFVTTARAKGLGESRVILAHALKNAAVPVVTLVGLQFGTLLGGAVVTETIFAWPGVGRLSVQAIYNRDYPVVQASVFTLAATFVLVNLIVDVLYTYLDPRIRLR